MLVRSGGNDDTQWFDYVTGYFAQTTRLEWDKGTMNAVIPADTANFLIGRKYARPMTEAEIEAYTAPVKKPETAPNVEPEPVPAPKVEAKVEPESKLESPAPMPVPRAKARNKGE